MNQDHRNISAEELFILAKIQFKHIQASIKPDSLNYWLLVGNKLMMDNLSEILGQSLANLKQIQPDKRTVKINLHEYEV